jgi:lysophospholipase L1-like esterase
MPVAVTAVALLVVELCFRLFSPNFYVGEKSFIEEVRIRAPHMDYRINRRFIDPTDPSVRLRTDARSYYLPSARFEDPDATIAFFGGSTTECAAVKEGLRFPALTSTLLEKKGLRVNVLNVALSGNTSHDALNVLLNHVVLDHPDVAVLMEASNDIGVLRQDPEYRTRMARPLGGIDLVRWTKQWLSSHSWFVARMRYTAAELQGMGVRPVAHREQNVLPGSVFPEKEFRQRLRAFIGLARAFEIEPVLMTQPYAQFRTEITPDWKNDTAQDEANQLIRDVAAQQGVIVIDLMDHLRSEVPDFNEPMVIFYDAIHVTDRGSQVLAEKIAETLFPSLTSRRLR